MDESWFDWMTRNRVQLMPLLERVSENEARIKVWYAGKRQFDSDQLMITAFKYRGTGNTPEQACLALKAKLDAIEHSQTLSDFWKPEDGP